MPLCAQVALRHQGVVVGVVPIVLVAVVVDRPLDRYLGNDLHGLGKITNELNQFLFKDKYQSGGYNEGL